MKSIPRLAVLLLIAMPGLARAQPAGEVQFSVAPTATRAGDAVRIEFALDRPADVAVEVRDAKGRIVRHLAAGALGPNTPAPLKTDSLAQSLTWDGRDDAGKPVDPVGCTVRVGAGLRVASHRAIGYAPQTMTDIKALAVDAGGNVFCLNGYSVPSLMVFAREGKYLRTLLPHSAKLPADRLGGVELLTRGDGVKIPRLVNMRDPYGQLAEMGLNGLTAWGAMAITPDGQVLIAGPGKGPAAGTVAMVAADGSSLTLRGPRVLPDGCVGVTGLAVDPTGKTIYSTGPDGEGGTGLFATPADGKAEPRRLVEPLDQPHGLAVDAKGNIYIAETGADQVRVVDPAGKTVATVVSPGVLRVAVGKDGQLYTLSQEKVVKVTAPLSKAAVVWQVDLAPTAGNPLPTLALDASADRPVVWVGNSHPDYGRWTLLRIEDQGDKPAEPREFADHNNKFGLDSPVHLSADPTRDEVYVREWRESWRGQFFRRFNGAGQREDLPIRGNEVEIGPDGNIYVRSFHGGEAGSWIGRFDHEALPLPLPGSQGPDAPVTLDPQKGFWMLDSLRGATAVGMKGFDVAPNGDIYVLRYYSSRGGKGPATAKGFAFPTLPEGVDFLTPLIDVFSPDGKLKRSEAVAYFNQGACGVRVDRQGNIYVADHITPKGRIYPDELAGQLPAVGGDRTNPFLIDKRANWYAFNCGSLFKFPPAGGRIAKAPADAAGAQLTGFKAGKREYATVAGALWQHVGISPAPANADLGRGVACVCTNGRFDLDGFGRAFVPDVLRFAVDVLDANGNRITSIGRYGNVDDTGEVHINWGAFVACTPAAVYICDNLNRRIVRVEMGYRVQADAAVK